MSTNERKNKIIKATLQRFAHYGIPKTSMNEIAEDMRISKANLYYYFPDKETLVREVLCFISHELFAKRKHIIDSYTDSIKDAVFNLIELNGEYLKKYYMLYIAEHADWVKDKNTIQLLEGFHKQEAEVIVTLFNKAAAQGELEPLDMEHIGHLYMEIMDGLIIQRMVFDIISEIPDASKVEVIIESQKQAALLILNGLSKRKL